VQKTLRHTVSLNGKGLHSAKPANLRLLAAPVDHGIVFCRTDVDDGRDPRVPALYNNVSDTTLNTRISNADGVSVSTIEHLMAALSGCGVHKALIEIDGPEINFEQAAIGRQSCALDMANGTFLRELSDCRTFCSQDDVDKMRANGLALGGSYHNAIVVQGERILSPNGLRRPDECVRHKMLDALGDLHLAGLPIWGTYQGYKSGHGLTNRLLRKLLSTPDAFEIVTADEDMTARLPGMSVDHSDLAAVV
jgi:UDP-3-O-[3-hydroxymyristoyl] N-acetylglucosamine deacetylase